MFSKVTHEVDQNFNTEKRFWWKIIKKNAPEFTGALNINDQVYIESIGTPSNYLSLQADSIKTVSDKNLAGLQILKFASLQKREEPKPGEKPKPGEEPKPGEPSKPGEKPKPGEPSKPAEPSKPGEVLKPEEESAQAQARKAAGFANLNGNFIKIALGMDKDNTPLFWALNSKGEIFEGKITESTTGIGMSVETSFKVEWKKISDYGKSISVGTDGTGCAINMANTVYEFDGKKWKNLGQGFDKISVGNQYEIWALKESENAIYKFDQGNNSWQKIGDGYIDISVGADGTIWAVKKDSRVVRKSIGSDTWDSSKGTNFVQIACGDVDDVWGITKDGALWQNTKPEAAVEGTYIQDNWSKILEPKYEGLSVNSPGSVAILSSEKIEDNYPLYYKKGTGISVGKLLEKIGLLPEMTPTQALDLIAQKPESEKLNFYARLVEWAKNNKKEFNADEQRTLVFGHLYPLYLKIEKEADADRKRAMQYQLMIILNNIKDYQPMAGIYAQPLEFSMMKPLQAAGILLPGMQPEKPTTPEKIVKPVQPVTPKKEVKPTPKKEVKPKPRRRRPHPRRR